MPSMSSLASGFVPLFSLFHVIEMRYIVRVSPPRSLLTVLEILGSIELRFHVDRTEGGRCVPPSVHSRVPRA